MPFLRTLFLSMYNETATCVLREVGRGRRVAEAEQKQKAVLSASSEEYCTRMKKKPRNINGQHFLYSNWTLPGIGGLTKSSHMLKRSCRVF